MTGIKGTTVGSLLATIALMVSGCGDSDKDKVTGGVASEQSCVICHLDQTALMSLAVEDEPGHDDAGEG